MRCFALKGFTPFHTHNKPQVPCLSDIMFWILTLLVSL